MESACPYTYIFETAPSKQAEKLKSYDDVPRPFMFFSKLQDKTHYRPGECLEVELRLFGRGNDFFPYFVLAFTMMGERGLGARRKSFRLIKVIGLNPLSRLEQVVYDGESNKVIAPKYIIEGKEIFSNLRENIANAIKYPDREKEVEVDRKNTMVQDWDNTLVNQLRIEDGLSGPLVPRVRIYLPYFKAW